ncbi:MAG TPA: TerC family protein, partial [Candidatus Limnocylindria bacterium]
MDLSAVIAIVLIDLALSGDNALLIGMAARRLPDAQRRRAIVLGGGLAVVLRIAAAAVVTFLLAIPYLQLAGGIVLAVIAYRLVRP